MFICNAYNLELYTNNLKNWDFDKDIPPNFCLHLRLGLTQVHQM
jgi:hypothetical protein